MPGSQRLLLPGGVIRAVVVVEKERAPFRAPWFAVHLDPGFRRVWIPVLAPDSDPGFAGSGSRRLPGLDPGFRRDTDSA